MFSANAPPISINLLDKIVTTFKPQQYLMLNHYTFQFAELNEHYTLLLPLNFCHTLKQLEIYFNKFL